MGLVFQQTIYNIGDYMHCIHCDSDNLKKLGMRFMGKEKGLGYTCLDCDKTFVVPTTTNDAGEEEEDFAINDDLHYVRDDDFIDDLLKSQIFVFTCAVNNTEVNEKFFGSLQSYCASRDAKLVIFPIRYRNPSMIHTSDEVDYPASIVPYLVENNLELLPNVRALGGLKTQATTENPLTGVDGMSKGASLIIGHPQVALKTLPRNADKYPAIITTTGAITEKHYSTTKMGYKAAFNHSMSAAVVEIDHQGDFFIRHLNFDGEGFYDVNGYYTSDNVEYGLKKTLGLVTGDEHAIFSDETVISATYFAQDSIVATLKPEKIVRHDILDSYAISHHHKKSFFTMYEKHHSPEKRGSMRKEMLETIGFIDASTPNNTVNIVVAANHNDHLYRWLDSVNPDVDYENALLFHELRYKMLLAREDSGVIPEPFELFANDKLKSNTIFLGRDESYKIGEIEISNHGDVGVHGSRGSSRQFSNLPVKTITGHSHSPVIDKGNYTVGTTSLLRLEYNKGLSAWHHAHVVVYPNGKRQMIFIVNGKWRKEF
jgi:hypothetical protein